MYKHFTCKYHNIHHTILIRSLIKYNMMLFCTAVRDIILITLTLTAGLFQTYIFRLGLKCHKCRAMGEGMRILYVFIFLAYVRQLVQL